MVRILTDTGDLPSPLNYRSLWMIVSRHLVRLIPNPSPCSADEAPLVDAQASGPVSAKSTVVQLRRASNRKQAPAPPKRTR